MYKFLVIIICLAVLVIGCGKQTRHGVFINNPAIGYIELKADESFLAKNISYTGGYLIAKITPQSSTVAGKYSVKSDIITLTFDGGISVQGKVHGDSLIFGDNHNDNSVVWVLSPNIATGSEYEPVLETEIKKQQSDANRDAIMKDLASLGADCFQYMLRSSSMGGGEKSFNGYTIDPNGAWGASNTNATYVIFTQNATIIKFVATSKLQPGSTIDVTYDISGKVTSGPNGTGF